MRLLAVVLLVSLLGACSEEDSALLVVDLRTDLTSGEEFVDVEVTVSRTSGAVLRQVVSPAPAAGDLSLGFRIAELDGLPADFVRVEVCLRDELGAAVLTRTISIELTGSDALVVTARRSCGGVVCPGADDAPGVTACLGGACVLPACAEGDADSCDVPSMPLAELLRQSVGATCEMAAACMGPVNEILFRGEESCEALVRRSYEDIITPVLNIALAEGTVIYHADEAHGCLNAVRNDCLGFTVTKRHLECVEAIEGTVEIGGECTIDLECAGVGSFCDPGVSCPAVCAPRRQPGEPCGDDDDCVTGVLCDREVGLCVTQTADGERCGEAANTCGFGSFCQQMSGGPSFSCQPVREVFSRGLDESCGVREGSLCRPGLSCAPPGQCVETSAAGAPCVRGALPDPCPTSHSCDEISATCVALPSPGEPCRVVEGFARCAPGAVCAGSAGVSGICVERRAVGETCDENVQCSLPYCDGVCRRSC